MQRHDDEATSQDFRLERHDFDRLARLINRASGIKMPPSKLAMVEGRLRRRVRVLGFADFREYCRYVFDEGGLAEERSSIIDAVTTNKTEFFREPEHFSFLQRVVLPGRTAGLRADLPVSIKLWSAACSCGAEPYTLAMVLEEFAAAAGNLRWTIVASDLSTEMLAEAQSGIFAGGMATPIPEALRRRYLMRSRDGGDHRVRVVPELRSRVRFVHLNLMDATYPVENNMDVIFCRNVLIYFDKPTQEAVLARLCRHLAPGGYLFLGHSESINGMTLPLRAAGPTIFVKT